MYYQHIKDPNGPYRAADGTRWELSAASTVRPTTGWTRFDTTDACLAAWELVYDPLPEPTVAERRASVD